MNNRLVATLAMLVLLMLALPVMSLLTGKRLRVAMAGRLTKLWRYSRTIVILWSLTALAVYALRLHGLGPSDVGVRPPRYAWELLLGLVFVCGILTLGAAARRALDGDYRRAITAVVPATAAQWALFVPLAATAGVCEEFLYRGYALWAIHALSGSLWAAALLSSLAFGLGHAYQGKAGMIGATASGLFYALVFLVTGSLLPCMLGHFTQDIAGAILLRRALDAGVSAAPEAA